MAALAEAINQQDDWTGITSATERRRRQTRLNSRAFRRRRAQAIAKLQHQPQCSTPTTKPALRTICRSEAPYWSENHQSIITLPTSAGPSAQGKPCRPILPHTTSPTIIDNVIFPLSVDHLITLLQFNVLRACLVNRDYISLLQPHGTEWSSESIATLPSVGPSTLTKLLPDSLHPTALQKTVPHAAWIDIFPHPIVRDNLIRITTQRATSSMTSIQSSESSIEIESESREFDEDALWTANFGSLFFDEDGSDEHVDDFKGHGGGIVWDPPWDISGWEMSAELLRKYTCMFRGCEGEVLDATNRWRRGRGEEDLVIEVV